MNMPRFSILIPVWNGGTFLREAIESALQQTLPPHEIIIADNGSTDDTPSILRDFAGRITTFRHPENIGSVRNFVAVAERATGDHLLWLPADDRLHPELLATAAEQLTKHPEVGLWFCSHQRIDQHGRLLPTKRPTEFETGGVIAGKQLVDYMLRFGQPMTVNATIVPGQVYKEVGGFDTQFMGICDYDLYLRIAGRYPVYVEPKPLADIRQHQQQHSVRVLHRDNGDPDRLFAKIGSYSFLSIEQQRDLVQGLCEYARQYFSRPLRIKGVSAAEVVRHRQSVLGRLSQWRNSRHPYSGHVRIWPRKPLALAAWLAGSTRFGVMLARAALALTRQPDLGRPEDASFDPGSELATAT